MTPQGADEELQDLERLVGSANDDPSLVRRLAISLERAGRPEQAWLVLCAGGQDDPRLGELLFDSQSELLQALGLYDHGTSKLWGVSHENPPWNRPIATLRTQRRPILALKASYIGATPQAPAAFLRAPSLLALRLEGFPTDVLEISPSKNLRWLELWSPELNDHDLKGIGRLSALEVLRLGPSEIAGSGLEALSSCSRLRSLSLASSRLRDEHLPVLEYLPKLQRLDLYETQITDAGLQHLAKLPKLNDLELGGTWITDSGLRTLAQFPALRRLSLTATRTSRRGRAILEKKLPQCRVQA